jgi:dTDP-4-dehydrorhamnose reductase
MRILITGASGQLGAYLLRELHGTGDTVCAWSGTCGGELFGKPLRPVNLTDHEAVVEAFHDARPNVIVHAGAMAAVSDCYRDPVTARLVNINGTQRLAELAAENGARLILVSTDMVFDGEQGHYRESDAPRPLSVYGQTKVAAERLTLTVPRHVVVRVSLLFGPSLIGRPTFFDQKVAALRDRKPRTLFTDEWRTPLSLAVAARGLLTVARSDVTGLLHLGGPERLSRYEMGQRLAAYLKSEASVFVPVNRENAPSPEPRPRDVSLDSTSFRARFPDERWPTFEAALVELFESGGS